MEDNKQPEMIERLDGNRVLDLCDSEDAEVKSLANEVAYCRDQNTSLHDAVDAVANLLRKGKVIERAEAQRAKHLDQLQEQAEVDLVLKEFVEVVLDGKEPDNKKCSFMHYDAREGNGIQIGFNPGWATKHMAQGMFSLMDAMGAENYVECNYKVPNGVALKVLVQRVYGKTPAMLFHESQDKLAALTTTVKGLVDTIRACGGAPSKDLSDAMDAAEAWLAKNPLKVNRPQV